MVKLLISKGADKHLKDAMGMDALMIAQKHQVSR